MKSVSRPSHWLYVVAVSGDRSVRRRAGPMGVEAGRSRPGNESVMMAGRVVPGQPGPSAPVGGKAGAVGPEWAPGA